jgi:putative ABC transport system permease protein
MMLNFRQIVTVTDLNLKGMRQRIWTSLVIVVGVASATGVLLSMLSFSTGLERAIEMRGDPGRVLVLQPGAWNEGGQRVSRDAAVAILNAPGVMKDSDGEPIASGESLQVTPAVKRVGQIPTRMFVRGIGPKGIVIRPEFNLVDGRMFQPGSRELIVGIAAQGQIENVEIGDMVTMQDGPWPIVGTFSSGGTSLEGEILTDVDTLMSSRRATAFGSLYVRLESPESFPEFAAAVNAIPSLDLGVQRETEFLARLSGVLTPLFSTLAYFLGAIIAIGALFGTINIMHSAVAARTQEIATLRAIGFGSTPVAISVLTEAVLLSVIGALIGASGAWILFDGNQNSLGGFVVFDLAVTPGLLLIGVSWALVIALLGAIFPAIRAARLPLVTALRAT